VEPSVIRFKLVVALVAIFALSGIARAGEKFEKIGVYLEATVEDQDSEVMFEAIGGDKGMAALKVVAPDGRTVVDFKAPDSKQGIRHVQLESPEPKDKNAVRRDFPEGIYKFSGMTTAGGSLQGETRLSHKLPDPSGFVQPAEDATNVSVTAMQVRWKPVKGVAKWLVVIEHEATGAELRITLPPAVTAFVVPDGFLAGGQKYKLGISAVSSDGNSNVIETDFTTVAQR
jgi:hypothetical protein